MSKMPKFVHVLQEHKINDQFIYIMVIVVTVIYMKHLKEGLTILFGFSEEITIKMDTHSIYEHSIAHRERWFQHCLSRVNLLNQIITSQQKLTFITVFKPINPI